MNDPIDLQNPHGGPQLAGLLASCDPPATFRPADLPNIPVTMATRPVPNASDASASMTLAYAPAPLPTIDVPIKRKVPAPSSGQANVENARSPEPTHDFATSVQTSTLDPARPYGHARR